MHLAVYSHKPCWQNVESPTGYATFGGFPFQMRAMADLFDSTTLVLPYLREPQPQGEIFLVGKNLDIKPLTNLTGQGWGRKLRFPFWFLRNLPLMWREARKADAIHAPIPGDIGTAGIFLALLLRKPLFVRHCGNWLAPRTAVERFWIWLMEKIAGGKNVMLATGGQPEPPSQRNPNIHWIFATSLTEDDLESLGREVKTPSAEDGPRIIIACRQEPEKATDQVIAAMPVMRNRFMQASLDIIGDGNALPSLREQVERQGLNSFVHIHGHVNHERVLELMQSADLFCHPTYSDGFPKAVLEALACGLPVITTKVSVLPHLVGSDCGVLLDTIDVNSIAEAVERCFNNRERYEQMSNCAKKRARQYSLEAWGQEIGGHLQTSWGRLSVE